MKIKNYIIDVIFWLIFLVITVLLSSNGVLVCDDVWSSKLFRSGLELPKGIAVSHGSWLYPLEKLLFVILPDFLNINIQDWAINFGCFLKTITIMSFLLFFYKFTDGYNFSKIKRYLICACSYFTVYIFCSRYRFVDFIIYEGFLRFIFSSLLLIWFIYCIYSVYIKELKLKKYYFGAFISGAFLSSANIETGFIAFSFLTVLFIFKFKTENSRKVFLPGSLGLISGVIYLFFQPVFWHYTISKIGSDFDNFSFDFSGYFNHFLYFIKNDFMIFANKLFFDYKIFVVSLILLTIFAIIKSKGNRETAKKLFFSLSLYFSVILFNLCLTLTGRSDVPFGGEPRYHFEHPDLHTVFYFVYIICLIILFCEFLKNYKKSALILFISSAVLLGYFIPVAVKFSYINDMQKRFVYIRDKIMLFYNYQNKEAILPKCFNDDHDYAHMWLMYEYYPVSLEDYVFKNPGLNFIDDINTRSAFTFYKEVTYFKDFGYENYGNENYISSKKALKIFVNEGGSYDEAFNGKIKFKNLENIDFVLNKNI